MDRSAQKRIATKGGEIPLTKLTLNEISDRYQQSAVTIVTPDELRSELWAFLQDERPIFIENGGMVKYALVPLETELQPKEEKS